MRDAVPLLGPGAPDAETAVSEVLLPLERELETLGEDEVDYLQVYERAWRRAGVDAPRAVLYRVLDREQQVWDAHVRPLPDALPTLAGLRERGLRTAIASNAPFPPEMMRRQMRRLGFLDAVDAVVLSAEVGRRKPAPELYRAGLQAVGVGPDEALYVGDRLSEDYDGPRRLGMRALLLSSSPPPGVEAISRLAELLERL
ncbi:MAG: HAD family hydrolase [Chloroflexi bacterium]|nr:MAG: HAD family hydrolase [Chloroflexota bacterium]